MNRKKISLHFLMKIYCNKLLAFVLLSIIKDSIDSVKVEITKEKIDFIKKMKRIVIFLELLTLFIKNGFSASHLVKLFIPFRISI